MLRYDRAMQPMQPGSPPQARCSACGAPDDGELVMCRFCKNAISPELLASAISCPQCHTACRWGKQKCTQCSAWIVVACVFCGAISPCNQPACMGCHEPFAGAMQRKQAQMQQIQQQQHMQTAGIVGNIAASFLGAAAGGVGGAVVGSALSHSWFGDSVPHHHHSWNDDTPFFSNDQPAYDNSAAPAWTDANAGEANVGNAGDSGDSGSSDWGGGDSGDSGGGSSDF